MKKPAAKAPSGVKRPQAPDPEPEKEKDKKKSKGKEEREDVENEEKESRRKAKIERKRQIEEVLQEFEDSNDEAGKEVENPPKARQLKPQTSGPTTVDEDEMMEVRSGLRSNGRSVRVGRVRSSRRKQKRKLDLRRKCRKRREVEPNTVPDTAASPPSKGREKVPKQARCAQRPLARAKGHLSK